MITTQCILLRTAVSNSAMKPSGPIPHKCKNQGIWSCQSCRKPITQPTANCARNPVNDTRLRLCHGTGPLAELSSVANDGGVVMICDLILDRLAKILRSDVICRDFGKGPLGQFRCDKIPPPTDIR